MYECTHTNIHKTDTSAYIHTCIHTYTTLGKRQRHMYALPIDMVFYAKGI